MTHDVVLEGCRPVPLAHYLKALGVLRLVSEQCDPEARGWWQSDRFVLRTTLGRAGLERFFLEEYKPTPIVGPWGARSGFYPGSSEKSAREALAHITRSSDPRLAGFAATIARLRALLQEMGITSKKQVDERKHEVMQQCRSRLDDVTLPWLDACFTLVGHDEERFPPILGTGGNEGSGSYMSGYAQQVAACIARREHDASLPAALWGGAAPAVLVDQTPGHFLPSAGGANAVVGFGKDPSTNPWEYLLCLEGTLLFSSSVSRRADASPPSRRASAPFTVESASAGYATATDEKNRGELWTPIWRGAASFGELRALFAEGRAVVGGHAVRNGLDFARAVASLGVDRGIARFERYGLHQRNGQSNIAVFLGQLEVAARPRVMLLHEIDSWLDRFRGKAGSDKAPAAARRTLRQLEGAILELCVHGDGLRLLEVLIALGRCEREMANSRRWTEESFLRPIPPLSLQWLLDSDDGSAELRLAAALASVWGHYKDAEGRRFVMSLRRQLEPVTTWVHQGTLQVRWDFDAARDVVWAPTHVAHALNACLQRRLVRSQQSGTGVYSDRGRFAALEDVAAFIEGEVDDGRLADLLWGCILLDWPSIGAQQPERGRSTEARNPGALYALMKLCFAGGTIGGLEIPLAPQIHRMAAAGNGFAASQQAVRRLRGSGLAPALDPFRAEGYQAKRSAAALLFPISRRDLRRLAAAVLRPGALAEDKPPDATESNEGATT